MLFRSGVATVVTKLLNQAQADVALFGEKDYQQLLVIRALARDLDIGTRIVGCPTLRDADGLAMSSRNVYLDARQRKFAPYMHQAMIWAAERIRDGESIKLAINEAAASTSAAGYVIDYFEARDATTLAPVEEGRRENIRLLFAGRMGTTRLIDNIPVPVKG